MASVSGINHITFSVADLERSLSFYIDILGANIRVQWAQGAYLELGKIWICLSQTEKEIVICDHDYSHIALGCKESDFRVLHDRITAHCEIWQNNSSEGDSIYFCDPDGHKLEIHIGSLESRLEHYNSHPQLGVEVFDS